MIDMLPFVGALLLAVALPLLVFAVVPARVLTDKERMARRTGRATPARRAEVPVSDAAHPGAFGWIEPSALVTRLARNLGLAGLQQEWPVARVLRVKALITALALVLAALFVATGPSPLRVVLALVVVGIAYAAPDVVVSGRAQERQAVIERELADALDQITISIEAGLGLESAMARTGQFGTGPLAQELTRTVQDMRVGFSRREAYLALAARTSVPDLRRFARAVLQADQYGISIGNVVRTQAKELREKRRQRAEEKAMRVPVTVLFPLLLCILPVLFIVVLAPAVMNLVSALTTLPR